jgi:glutathione S-transferase
MLAPAAGTIARYHLQEWLNFVSSEIHKSFSPLFSPTTPEDYKPIVRAKILDRLTWVDSQLVKQLYLLSDHFSVADAYLYTITRWTQPMNLDISKLTRLNAFMARVEARPAVQEALKFEGLLK